MTRRLVWLSLLMLVSVNSVLVWHGVAHWQQSLTSQWDSSASQAPTSPDNHCDLCLSAHGVSAGVTSDSYALMLLAGMGFWLVMRLPVAVMRPRYARKARAPPRYSLVSIR